MKKEIVNDCLLTVADLKTYFEQLAEIETVREQYKKGEPLKLSVTCGATELCERLLLSNGKALFMQDVFNAFELQKKLAIQAAVSTLQTFLEVANEK